jgi:hypothetical protein
MGSPRIVATGRAAAIIQRARCYPMTEVYNEAANLQYLSSANLCALIALSHISAFALSGISNADHFSVTITWPGSIVRWN